MAFSLRLDDLQVTSFQTAESPSLAIAPSGDPAFCCCTGCDSGCGINPTAGGCESKGDTLYCTKDIDCYAAA